MVHGQGVVEGVVWRRVEGGLAGGRRGLHTPHPLVLVATVLEPDLDLRGGQLDAVRHVFSLRRRQVALLLEAPLQLVHLRLVDNRGLFRSDSAT